MKDNFSFGGEEVVVEESGRIAGSGGCGEASPELIRTLLPKQQNSRDTIAPAILSFIHNGRPSRQRTKDATVNVPTPPLYVPYHAIVTTRDGARDMDNVQPMSPPPGS